MWTVTHQWILFITQSEDAMPKTNCPKIPFLTCIWIPLKISPGKEETSRTQLYHHAKFHADRPHCHCDTCPRKQRKTQKERITADKTHSSVVFAGYKLINTTDQKQYIANCRRVEVRKTNQQHKYAWSQYLTNNMRMNRVYRQEILFMAAKVNKSMISVKQL